MTTSPHLLLRDFRNLRPILHAHHLIMLVLVPLLLSLHLLTHTIHDLAIKLRRLTPREANLLCKIIRQEVQ